MASVNILTACAYCPSCTSFIPFSVKKKILVNDSLVSQRAQLNIVLHADVFVQINIQSIISLKPLLSFQ